MSYPIYDIDPVIPLRDHKGNKSVVRLERVYPLSANYAGDGTAADPMLRSWIGGRVDGVKIWNAFKLTNIPSGTYALYVYHGHMNGTNAENTTTYYVSVNGGSEVATSSSISSSATWSNIAASGYGLASTGVTYRGITGLVIPENGVIGLRIEGNIAGLQLIRQLA